jgi:hypothetical protein
VRYRFKYGAGGGKFENNPMKEASHGNNMRGAHTLGSAVQTRPFEWKAQMQITRRGKYRPGER